MSRSVKKTVRLKWKTKKLINLINYKGYEGYFIFDTRVRIFYGQSYDTKPFISFQGKNFNEVEKAFHSCIDECISKQNLNRISNKNEKDSPN